MTFMNGNTAIAPDTSKPQNRNKSVEQWLESIDSYNIYEFLTKVKNDTVVPCSSEA